MRAIFRIRTCLTMMLLLLLGGMAQAREVQWDAINPAFRGATFVNDPDVCLGCHDDVMPAYAATAHARAFRFNPKNPLQAADCEACHGPRSTHVENPDIQMPAATLTAPQQAAICLQCHQGGDQMHWHTSAHADLSCRGCHTVMEKRSQRYLLSAASESTVCYSCHVNIRAQAQKIYRHPIREGKVNCSDCHNPHGSVTRGMLTGISINETCYKCHQEKRGPFLWEHAPVRENCMTCHEPHGSNNRDLLIAKGPAQCVTCHQYGGHINQFRYNRVSTPYAQGCANCHVTLHGSNHPSGVKFNR